MIHGKGGLKHDVRVTRKGESARRETKSREDVAAGERERDSPSGQRVSSAVTMSTPLKRFSLNSCTESEEGKRPEIPEITMSLMMLD